MYIILLLYFYTIILYLQDFKYLLIKVTEFRQPRVVLSIFTMIMYYVVYFNHLYIYVYIILHIYIYVYNYIDN